jgi:hypothetical protein
VGALLWSWLNDATGVNNTDASAAPLSRWKTESLTLTLVMLSPHADSTELYFLNDCCE